MKTVNAVRKNGIMVMLLGLLCVLLLFVSSTTALTGNIGNARMVLRVSQGDNIDKCILVKNVNDEDINVKLFPAGDLADYITLKDEEFILKPQEEKNACFTIVARKSGTTETKMNVMFSPLDRGNGVGLSSTIIVIAKETSFFDGWFDDENEETDIEKNEAKTINTITDESEQTNELLKSSEVKTNLNTNKLIFIFSGITAILFVLLLALLLYQKSKRSQHMILTPTVETKQRKRVKQHE